MEISAGTLGVWADWRGLSCAACEVGRRHDGRRWRFRANRRCHLGQDAVGRSHWWHGTAV